MTTLPQLVLASASPYRARLLQRLGLPFEVAPANIDESTQPGESAMALALRLAEHKALSLSRHPASDPLIIGSDQVAACDNRLLGKPGTKERAIEQLTFCSGKHIVFFTGLALCRPDQQHLESCVVPIEVSLRRLTDAEIERYVEREQPLDCAGSFKWESLGITLFRAINGDDVTALEGLPLIELSRRLRHFGFQLP